MLCSEKHGAKIRLFIEKQKKRKKNVDEMGNVL